MKKGIISLFVVVSMSFTSLYPNLSLNDNVLVIEKDESIPDDIWNEYLEEDDLEEVSLFQLMRSPRGEKKFKLKLWEWISSFSK